MQRVRAHLLTALKIGLSVALVWIAFRKIDLGAALNLAARIPVYMLGVTAVVLLFQQALTGARLHHLVRALGGRASRRASLDSVFIGVFFSQTFISFIGGDAMRVWRLTRESVTLSLAARAVLLDRVAGFVSLLLLILGSLPFIHSLIADPAMRTGVMVAAAAGGAAMVGFLSFSLAPAPMRQWRIMRLLADVSAQCVAIGRRPPDLVSLLSLSLLIQLLNVVAVYAIATGLGTDVGFSDLVLLVPSVLLLAMLPISFAGWGVREGAMVVALGLVGVPPEYSVAISICFGLSLIAIGLPGGLLWFFYRKPAGSGGHASREEG